MRYKLRCLFAFIGIVSAFESPSPCPDVFYYENDGYQWYGVITINHPPPIGTRMKVDIRLSVASRLQDNYYGKIEPYEDSNTMLYRLQHGEPIRYKVFFPPLDKLPQVVSIVLSGHTICSGPTAYGSYVSTIDLYHVYNSYITTTFNGQPSFNNHYRPPQTPGYHIFNLPTINITTPSTQPDYLNEVQPFNPNQVFDQNQVNREPPSEPSKDDDSTPFVACGKTASTTLSLVTNGNKALRGDWPWLVAIFLRKHIPGSGIVNHSYKCGGTLVSERLVLTAAHCTTKRNGATISPNKFILKLGAHNINNDGESSVINKGVDEIKTKGIGYDLAVIVLQSAVVFNRIIKPICLWEDNDDQNLIIGHEGYVVGWGSEEETVQYTIEPYVAVVNIVPINMCRPENTRTFSAPVDDEFCGMSRDLGTPCKGDSGDGLYMKRGDHWVIRGVVSAALRNNNEECDPRHRVLYVDVAKHKDWIYGI